MSKIAFPRTLRNVDPTRLSSAMAENMRYLENLLNQVFEMDHSQLTNVSADQHHVKYTDGEVDTIVATHDAIADAHHAEDHAATHSDGAADEIDVAALASVGAVGAWLERNGAGALQWSVPTGNDADAIHDDVAGEIVLLSEISAMGTGDSLIVEDSSDSDNKKKVSYENFLPAWTTYNPTYNNLTVGNGGVDARYMIFRDLVIVYYELNFGTTTTVDGNDPRISMPVTARTGYTTTDRLGVAEILDAGSFQYAGTVRAWNTTEFNVTVLKVQGSYIINTFLSATVPMTFTTNDKISFLAVYERA